MKLNNRQTLLLGAGVILSTASLMTMVLGGLDPAHARNRSFSGVVERVWEDGFQLRVGDRTIITDTWDVCGDSTARYVARGDRLTITGEFEGRQFDVFSITNAEGKRVCS
ncbi:hypothetical protein [Oscillatoria salina]|uniref:hypothetical protein n=1 Tax=Oscillatoria salina TaxID=331517 RepID=UPI001CCE770A|nr:hypothetical protein [Oscillatoria salina]